ncbi:MAG: hypothetical protein EXR99_13930, partial [Gemmataceae bacterium]|nr:hypothetical protein [Gemmataceae bacterium]
MSLTAWLSRLVLSGPPSSESGVLKLPLEPASKVSLELSEGGPLVSDPELIGAEGVPELLGFCNCAGGLVKTIAGDTTRVVVAKAGDVP